jgi:hypothetical protein
MSLLYQVEAWSDCWPEMAPLWPAHWREVATDQATIPLDVDHASYAAFEAAGALHVVTVRDPQRGGQLVGYHLTIVRPHLHYRTTLMGFTDVFWLHPDYRRGPAGLRLFRCVEETLRAKGVQKLFTGTKRSLDLSRLFERLGWTSTEVLFTKYLGDPPCS